MHHFPYIYTFYSYKGGVGRSMSLLNAAYSLSGRGRHVLVLDMDLEAPGISDFLQRTGELDNQPPKDILDLLQAVTAFEKKGGHPSNASEELGAFTDYIARVKEDKLIKPKLGEPGNLHIIPASVGHKDYWERLAGTGLETCSQEKLTKYGLILKHYLKAQRLTVSPPGLRELGEHLDVPYDYILVDSRTGITELGGLCVGPLADRLVILTSLNEQNVNGTHAMMALSGIKPQHPEDAEKPWDEGIPESKDDSLPHLLGPKPTMLVASPVPSGEISYKRDRINVLEEKIGKIAAKLSYHPQMALVESIFVRDYPEEYLAIEYTGFVDKVMALSSDSDHQRSRLFSKCLKEKQITEAVNLALRICSDDPELGVSLLFQINNSHKPSGEEEYFAFYQMYGYLVQLGGDDALLVYNNWGNALSDQAKVKTGEEADRLFTLSYEKFEKAITIKPDDHEALYNWGTALSDQARVKTDEEADRLFTLSYEKFEKAITIKPDDHEALYNWGFVLSDQANVKTGEEADRLFSLCYEKYEKALAIKPDLHNVLYNWGTALSYQANVKTGEEADRLFSLSYEKFKKALAIKPDLHNVLYNWGTALSDQAKVKTGEDADRLFSLCYETFEKALAIKPDDHEAFNNWGNALSDQAEAKTGEEADRLYSLSYEKYEKSLEIKPDFDFALYNQACWWAIHKNVTQAVDKLKQVKPLDSKLANDITNDPNFAGIINHPDFKAFLDSLAQ